MATISIGSNIASLRAQRSLNDSSAMLERVSERLSTGLRINHASDDAAGLAIASSLNADSRIYSTALRNISDGVSILSIAEGALSQLSTIVTRQLELAEQAANGTYTTKQRRALQNESTALTSEYNRIIATTSFNGTQVFNTTNNSLNIQAGSTSGESIEIATGQALRSEAGNGVYTGVQTVGAVNNNERVASADFNGDGSLDLITSDASGSGTIRVFLNNGSGTFTAQTPIATGTASAYDFEVTDLNNDSIIDFAISSGGTNQAVFIGNGNGTFKAPHLITLAGPSGSDDVESGDLNGDGFKDLIFSDRLTDKIYISIGNGNGTFKAASFLSGTVTSRNVAVGDINGDGKLDIVNTNTSGSTSLELYFGNGDGTFSSMRTLSGSSANTYTIDLQDINFDGNLDLAYGSTSAYIRLGNGDGTFAAETAYALAGSTATETVYMQDINGDGRRDLISTQQQTDDRISYFYGNGDGTFGALHQLAPGDNPIGLTFGDFNNDLITDIVSNVRQTGILGIFFQGQSSLPQQGYVNIMSQADARNALTTLRTDLSQVTNALGVLGAHASRLSVAHTNVTSLITNYEQAESRIFDADIAAEAASYTKLTIAREIGASILAQANLSPQTALSLIR